MVDAELSGGSSNVPADLDPATVNAVDDLARCLLQLYIRVGMPPLRVLELETARTAGTLLTNGRLESVQLGRTALSDMMAGRKLPSKAFLLTFVEACGINLKADRRWETAWDRLSPNYPDQLGSQEQGLHHQVAAMRARAERAEADNEQLRHEIAVMQTRAEQAEIDNAQLRRAIAVRIRPEQTNPAAGPPQPTPLQPWDPKQIGPFTLIGRLGGGAMGRVYLGRSAAGRLVAVKTVRPELAEEPGFRDRFAHEVAAARQISGMFTAAVVAADSKAAMPWLATAYVPAPTLNQLVRSRGPLPSPVIWWLAAGCAEALESIHTAGLIHGDLKPSNVLVAASGPLVIDFGVARDAERVELTVPPGAIGTPAYMSPEQARDGLQASTASDVFALGGSLLFAATGHAPYQGKTIADVLIRLATEPPDLSGLPAELTDLITSCLARELDARPTSKELLAKLGPLVKSLPPIHVTDSLAADPVMAFIEEFQRTLQIGADNDEAGA